MRTTIHPAADTDEEMSSFRIVDLEVIFEVFISDGISVLSEHTLRWRSNVELDDWIEDVAERCLSGGDVGLSIQDELRNLRKCLSIDW